MPNATWWNLPEDKRQRITEAAMAEFGARGFSGGSLNAIVSRAGIAKGSLFQYFEDKLDLFGAICEAGSATIERETVGVCNTDAPFFEFLHELFDAWITYFADHPLERGMAFAMANEVDAEVRTALHSTTNEHYAGVLAPLVGRAIERGEMRADVDPALVVSMVTMALRHLHSAPFESAGDPALRLDEMDRERLGVAVGSYVDAFERAFS